MKIFKTTIGKLFLILSVLVCYQACLPDGTDTLVLSYIPNEFLGEWKVGIRCKGYTFDAFIFDFNLNHSKEFKAESSGEDYNGQVRRAVFEGSYNPRTDSLIFTISLYNPDNDQLLRKERVSLLWSNYKGEYLPTTNVFLLSTIEDPCESEMILRFATSSYSVFNRMEHFIFTTKKPIVCCGY